MLADWFGPAKSDALIKHRVAASGQFSEGNLGQTIADNPPGSNSGTVLQEIEFG